MFDGEREFSDGIHIWAYPMHPTPDPNLKEFHQEIAIYCSDCSTLIGRGRYFVCIKKSHNGSATDYIAAQKVQCQSCNKKQPELYPIVFDSWIEANNLTNLLWNRVQLGEFSKILKVNPGSLPILELKAP